MYRLCAIHENQEQTLELERPGQKALPYRCDFEQLLQVFEESWVEDNDRLRPVDGHVDLIKE